MGRYALEQALIRHPELRPLLAHAEHDLHQAIRLLEPHAQRALAGTGIHPADPDLAFQLSILRQAICEIQFILGRETIDSLN